MNRSQRRASGPRCHDCRSRKVVAQADYGWLCDPCWIKREERITDTVLAGATALRPIDQDRPAPPCGANGCGRDAVVVVQFARAGQVVDCAACEQHMGAALDTAATELSRAT